MNIILIIILSGFLLLAGGKGHANGDVQFSWAIIGKTNDDDKSLDISSVLNLKAGDQLQIYIGQENGTFLYLFLLESTGTLVLLHPADILSYSTGEEVEQEVLIPDQHSAFTVAPPAGTEKLYLLASPKRLEKLESLVTAYSQSPDNVASNTAVMKEIKKLRRQHSKLKHATEIGVPIAGTVGTRSVKPTELRATQISANGFYSRIVRIKHD